MESVLKKKTKATGEGFAEKESFYFLVISRQTAEHFKSCIRQQRKWFASFKSV